jgi:hypothetical protein
MTKETAQEIFERAKRELPSWELVMNRTYTDEQVRDGIQSNLLKMFYEAIGNDGPVMRKPEQSYVEAIAEFLRDNPGSYHPHNDIEDVIEVAMEHRRRWQQ